MDQKSLAATEPISSPCRLKRSGRSLVDADALIANPMPSKKPMWDTLATGPTLQMLGRSTVLICRTKLLPASVAIGH